MVVIKSISHGGSSITRLADFQISSSDQTITLPSSAAITIIDPPNDLRSDTILSYFFNSNSSRSYRISQGQRYLIQTSSALDLSSLHLLNALNQIVISLTGVSPQESPRQNFYPASNIIFDFNLI